LPKNSSLSIETAAI